MTDTGKKKLRILLGVWMLGLGALGGMYVLVLKPQQESLQAVQRQADEEEQKRQELRLASMPTSREKRRQQMESLDQQRMELVGEFTDSSGITFAVNELARQHNLKNFTSSTVKYGGEAEYEKCQYLTEQRIRISFQADFIDFVKFVNVLERSRPVIFVDRFTAERDEENPAEVQADMELAGFGRKKTADNQAPEIRK